MLLVGAGSAKGSLFLRQAAMLAPVTFHSRRLGHAAICFVTPVWAHSSHRKEGEAAGSLIWMQALRHSVPSVQRACRVNCLCTTGSCLSSCRLSGGSKFTAGGDICATLPAPALHCNKQPGPSVNGYAWGWALGAAGSPLRVSQMRHSPPHTSPHSPPLSTLGLPGSPREGYGSSAGYSSSQHLLHGGCHLAQVLSGKAPLLGQVAARRAFSAPGRARLTGGAQAEQRHGVSQKREAEQKRGQRFDQAEEQVQKPRVQHKQKWQPPWRQQKQQRQQQPRQQQKQQLQEQQGQEQQEHQPQQQQEQQQQQRGGKGKGKGEEEEEGGGEELALWLQRQQWRQELQHQWEQRQEQEEELQQQQEQQEQQQEQQQQQQQEEDEDGGEEEETDGHSKHTKQPVAPLAAPPGMVRTGHARGRPAPLCFYFTQNACSKMADEEHTRRYSHAFPEMAVRPSDLKGVRSQPFDRLLVLDLEGRVEILEFPVLLLDTRTLQVVDRFHRFVRPVKMPVQRQREYIKGKYGRSKLDSVWHDTAIPFTEVLEQFEAWMRDHGLWEPATSARQDPATSAHQEPATSAPQRLTGAAFVTCGNWDIKTKIPEQCTDSGIAPPPYFSEWINLKDVYLNFYRRNASGMKAMLKGLNMHLSGTHHVGLDDAHNIASVLQRMLAHGAIVRITAKRKSPVSNDVKFTFHKRVK